MLTIDGSIGEGGGQILRSALALSMVGAIITHTFGFSSHLPTPGTRVYCPETLEEGPQATIIQRAFVRPVLCTCAATAAASAKRSKLAES